MAERLTVCGIKLIPMLVYVRWKRWHQGNKYFALLTEIFWWVFAAVF